MTVLGLSDYQFSLNGFTMGPGSSPFGLAAGSTVGLTEITGLDTPDVSTFVDQRANDHGAFVTARFHKERVVTIAGRLNTTQANYPSDTYQLKQTFLAQNSAIPLTFKLPGVVEQFLYVQPQGVKFAMRNTETAVGMVDFLATCTAADPRIYSTTTQNGAFSVATLSGGHAFPITFPFAFSTTSTAAATVTNAGNFRAPTIVTLYGPLTTPTVVCQPSGESFTLNLTLAAGDSVVVDALNRSVTLNGSGSVYSALTTTSRFLFIDAEMTCSLQLQANAGNGSANVSWSDTWL